MSVLVVISLIWQHGFPIAIETSHWLNWLDVVLAVGYALNLCLPLAWTRPVREYLRRHRFEFALLLVLDGLLVLILLVPPADLKEVLDLFRLDSLTQLFFDLIQLYVLANFFLQLLRLQQRVIVRGVRPEWILAGSFAGLIVAGTLLLLLPKANPHPEEPIRVVDAFFTATSASCVTGLVVRDTGTDFTTFGQMVIMALFQMGGLGIMTFVAFVSVFSTRSLPISQMLAFKQMVNARTFYDLKRQILAVIGATLVIELVGALFVFLFLDGTSEPLARIKWSVFHAISAFCNAGFALQPDSFILIQGKWGLMLTFMALIILGGLGFLVLPDLVGFKFLRLPLVRRLPFMQRLTLGRCPSKLSVQTRLSLVITVLLLGLGLVGFWILECHQTLQGKSGGESFLIAAFQSVTARTAGFNSVPIDHLRGPTLIMIMVLMVVGACPVSTGGGIKTVTFGVLILALRSMIKGSDRVEAFGRTLPPKALFAALSVFFLYVTSAILGIFLLALFDPGMALRDQAFEMISALSTVGLSTGITAKLSLGGKLVLCAAMFIGRVGPLSLVLSVFQAGSDFRYEYPEEEIVVG
jgi:trk/ktr system potassium uptake protein